MKKVKNSQIILLEEITDISSMLIENIQIVFYFDIYKANRTKPATDEEFDDMRKICIDLDLMRKCNFDYANFAQLITKLPIDKKNKVLELFFLRNNIAQCKIFKIDFCDLMKKVKYFNNNYIKNCKPKYIFHKEFQEIIYIWSAIDKQETIARNEICHIDLKLMKKNLNNRKSEDYINPLPRYASILKIIDNIYNKNRNIYNEELI